MIGQANAVGATHTGPAPPARRPGTSIPVEPCEPLRLPTKMKAFRTLTTDAELLEQRAELLIGSMLARSGVPFEFGKDHPDYVLGEQALGIEVGSRALDGPWALHDRLEELLAESQSDVSVQLSFDDRPLELGAARIEEIAQAIAAHPVNQPADSMRFGDVGLSAHLTRGVGIRGSQVTVAFAGGWGLDLSAHMADVERVPGQPRADADTSRSPAQSSPKRQL